MIQIQTQNNTETEGVSISAAFISGLTKLLLHRILMPRWLWQLCRRRGRVFQMSMMLTDRPDYRAFDGFIGALLNGDEIEDAARHLAPIGLTAEEGLAAIEETLSDVHGCEISLKRGAPRAEEQLRKRRPRVSPKRATGKM